MDDYALIDSGDELKLERFGEYTIARACPQAVWKKNHPEKWIKPDASFSRENGWLFNRKLPSEWRARVGGVECKILLTDFGHLGVFPEHAALWQSLRPLVNGEAQVLNLFAYSGGATLAFAQQGARVCHLDASKGMVDWARENAHINKLEKAPVRWIIDDALKFLKREVRREVRYDGILLDPPTFGRGSSGEVFKIETDLVPLLELCKQVLSDKPRFLVLSCHTPGLTPLALHNVVSQLFSHVKIETGEMALSSSGATSIPSGSFAKVLF
jgi:23S rRNA (cytosine1962-C5)-methyltransferase